MRTMRPKARLVLAGLLLCLATLGAPSSASAYCAPDDGVSGGCGDCPDPIEVKGRRIITFYCPM